LLREYPTSKIGGKRKFTGRRGKDPIVIERAGIMRVDPKNPGSFPLT